MAEEERLRSIERKLDKLCSALENHTQRFEEHAQDHKNWRDKTSRTIWGENGAVPGVLIRLDRLEQDSSRKTWFQRLIVGAIVTALTGAGFALFKS